MENVRRYERSSFRFSTCLLDVIRKKKKKTTNPPQNPLKYLTRKEKIFTTPPPLLPHSHLHLQQYHTPRPPGALHIPNSCQMSAPRLLINQINPINERSTKQPTRPETGSDVHSHVHVRRLEAALVDVVVCEGLRWVRAVLVHRDGHL